MKTIKLGINGFGRIGRNVFKVAHERGIEIVGVNTRAKTEILAHLLKYDSTQGKFNGTVNHSDEGLIVDGKLIPVTNEDNPINIKWAKTPNIVVESTGVFRKRESEKGGYGDHLKNGAEKVVLTVPAQDEIDNMIVLGINDDTLKASDKCISNASCTTNCIAPVAKVLNDNFGIEVGIMTTVHAYTNDQEILDAAHKDLRRARSAAVSIIPTTTGAAKAVGKVIPELAGKLDGMAMRVPVPAGSVVDLNVVLKKPTTKEEINAAMKKAAEEGPLKGILFYMEDPIVSCDIIHNSHSSIFDSKLTMVMDDGIHVKVVSWYDNEWSYSSRVVDLIEKISKL